MAASSEEPASAGLEEIVVTAERRADPLGKVPISISAYDQKTMDQQGVRSIEDIAALTPGVDFSSQNFGSGNNNFLAIRGVLSGNETLAGGNTLDPTGVYIDDVPIQSRRVSMEYNGAAFPEVFDLERVEILRGPQGTLFGAGAEGGAVRFITPQPSFTEYSSYARAESAATVQGDPSYEFGAAVGGPIIDNTLGFRVSAWSRSEGGWIDQVPFNATGQIQGTTVDSNSNSKQISVFKVAFAWAPIDGLVVTPSVYYQEVKGHDASIFWTSLSNPSRDEFRNGDVLAQPSSDKWELPALKVTANLGWAELTSNTAYFHRGAYADNDYTNFVLDIFSGPVAVGNPYPSGPGVNSPSDSTDSQDNFSEEVRLQSVDQSAAFTWLGGIFYTDAHQAATQTALLNDTAFPSIYHNVYTGSMLLVDKQIAGFVNANYKITDTLSATAGVRVSHDKLTFQESQTGLVVGAAAPYETGSRSDTPVTPKFVLSNQFDPNNLGYVSAAKGYRTGGVNGPVGDTCGVTASQTFDPDNLWSYEIGDKSRLFGNRIALDASAFYIKWKGIQQTLTLTCGFSTTLNLGDAISKGFDVTAQFLVTPEFQITEALGYTDAYYSQTVSGPGIPGVLVTKGDTLGVAPWTSTLVARYEFPAINGSHIYIRPEWIYHSHNSGMSQRQDPAAVDFYDPGSPLNPTTNMVNLRAGVTFDKFDVSLFVNNATNAHPLLSLTHYNANSPLYEATTFRPLTAGVTAIVRY